MLFTHMRPDQIQEAVKLNVPILMAAGVVEYHGPHLPVGTDILLAQHICEEVEKRSHCVLAPSLPFGSTMLWAGGAHEGEIDFAPDVFFRYVKEALRGYMNLGFRRIYILQHHAGLEGLQSLSCRMAAAELIREEALRWGAGWGRKAAADYPNPQIFEWIKVANIEGFSRYEDDAAERIPIGHAGKGETQLMMAAYPGSVSLEKLNGWTDEMPEWLSDATEATVEEGQRWLEFCIEGWSQELLSKPKGAFK